MKQLRTISRLLLGIVFVFSGFVKAVDPLGSTYKFEDYFNAFDLSFLVDIALPLAIVLASMELIVGLCLIFNVYIKKTSIIALLFMAFFTPLTLILALTNPVTDCGCFGDALIITNWETFYKNILLLIMAITLFMGRNKNCSKLKFTEQAVFIGIFTIFALSISIYSYRHLPILDFRPYHIGANINEGMQIPDDAERSEFKSIFKYQKDGIVEEFDETNYPWQDTSWIFVDSQQIEIKKGYEAPIHDFSISNDFEGDITYEILEDKGYTFLLVCKDLTKVSNEAIEQANKIAAICVDKSIRFICITASGNEEIEDFKGKHESIFEFYNTDEIQLKTLIRANPGLVLISGGTILNKWHYNDFPQVEELKSNLGSYTITQQQLTYNNLKVISITTILLLLLSLFYINRKQE